METNTEYLWHAEKRYLLPMADRVLLCPVDLAFTFMAWTVVDSGYAI